MDVFSLFYMFILDAIIGSVIHQLNEMNMLYTAAYTGKSSKVRV